MGMLDPEGVESSQARPHLRRTPSITVTQPTITSASASRVINAFGTVTRSNSHLLEIREPWAYLYAHQSKKTYATQGHEDLYALLYADGGSESPAQDTTSDKKFKGHPEERDGFAWPTAGWRPWSKSAQLKVCSAHGNFYDLPRTQREG